MRTTVRIDDDLMRVLKQQAEAAGESVTKALNRLLRLGLTAEGNGVREQRERFVQKTFNMGKPLIDMNKALAISFEMDDIERLRKLERQRRQREQDETDRH